MSEVKDRSKAQDIPQASLAKLSSKKENEKKAQEKIISCLVCRAVFYLSENSRVLDWQTREEFEEKKRREYQELVKEVEKSLVKQRKEKYERLDHTCKRRHTLHGEVLCTHPDSSLIECRFKNCPRLEFIGMPVRAFKNIEFRWGKT